MRQSSTAPQHQVARGARGPRYMKFMAPGKQQLCRTAPTPYRCTVPSRSLPSRSPSAAATAPGPGCRHAAKGREAATAEAAAPTPAAPAPQDASPGIRPSRLGRTGRRRGEIRVSAHPSHKRSATASSAPHSTGHSTPEAPHCRGRRAGGRLGAPERVSGAAALVRSARTRVARARFAADGAGRVPGADALAAAVSAAARCCGPLPAT